MIVIQVVGCWRLYIVQTIQQDDIIEFLRPEQVGKRERDTA